MPTRFRQLLLRRDVVFIASSLFITVVGFELIPSCIQQESPGRRDSDSSPEQKPSELPSAQTSDVRRRMQPDETVAQRREMVARQIEARGVDDPLVLRAMRNVPRHWFVPAHLHNVAYSDRPLPIGEGQTISQPYIVALMTEALQLTSNSKVLEIGTGSGYQAAVLSEITPHVFTIEIIESLARRAIATFESHGFETIRTKIGDGYAGWAEHAPFDAIIVTCAPDHVPPKLIEQLKPGGHICIPVGGKYAIQRLVVLTATEKGTLDREELIPVRFVPMTGVAQDPSSDD